MDYPTSEHKQLIKAIKSLKNEEEIKNFLRDLLTLSEVNAAAERWHIARLLWTTNLSYKEIAKITKSSTTTITRVAQWLEHGSNGYKTVLARLFEPNTK